MKPTKARRSSKKIKKQLVRRGKNVCSYCGRSVAIKNLTLDHVQPLSKGGEKRMRNLTLVCFHCNQAKGSMTEAEFRASLKKDREHE